MNARDGVEGGIQGSLTLGPGMGRDTICRNRRGNMEKCLEHLAVRLKQGLEAPRTVEALKTLVSPGARKE